MRSLPMGDKCFGAVVVNRIKKRKAFCNSGSPSVANLATWTKNSPPMSKPMAPSKGPFSLMNFLNSTRVLSIPSQVSHWQLAKGNRSK
eukprot:Skav235768  [mRNA]  locus=scaffold803:652270:652533:- [translate_table: standard]